MFILNPVRLRIGSAQQFQSKITILETSKYQLLLTVFASIE